MMPTPLKEVKTFSGRKASQNYFELTSFTNLLWDENVTSYCEIGAREGDTFFHVVSSMPVGSRAVAVDLPGGYWGKITTGAKLQKCAAALRAKGYRVTVVIGDSTSQEVIKRVCECAPFDAILIDGDHRYDGVKQDWMNYGILAPIVAFHDIVGKGQTEKVHNTEVEVPRLWAELKEQTDNFVEFIDAGSKMGIGVLL